METGKTGVGRCRIAATENVDAVWNIEDIHSLAPVPRHIKSQRDSLYTLHILAHKNLMGPL